MKKLKQYTSLLLLLGLASCGGGSPDLSNAAEKKYTGQRNLASLNNDNTSDFVNLLFAYVNAEGVTAANNSQNVSSLHRQARKIALSVQANFIYRSAKKPVNSTEACASSGEIITTGEMENNIGELSLEYKECKQGDSLLNGVVVIAVDKYNADYKIATNTTMTFDSFKISNTNNHTKYLTGKIKEIIDAERQTKIVTTHMHRLFPANNQQDLVNFTSTFDGSSYDFSGTLNDGKNGKVNLITKQKIFYNGYSLPLAGALLMTGAANSKLEVTAIGEKEDEKTGVIDTVFQIKLDADGDGLYETESFTF